MAAPSVFKTSLDNNRIYVPFVIDDNSVPVKLKGIIATGSKFTCVPMSVLHNSVDLQYTGERELIRLHRVPELVNINQVCIPSFTIGNVHLGQQYIYVTNEPSVNECTIGMDILSQVDFVWSAVGKVLGLRKVELKSTNIVTNENLADEIKDFLTRNCAYSAGTFHNIMECMPSKVSMSKEELHKLLRQFL